MKVKLIVHTYTPDTEFIQGRLVFKSKGTMSVIQIATYLDPLVILLKKLEVKRISWRETGYKNLDGTTSIPAILQTYIKPEKLALMNLQRQSNIVIEKINKDSGLL